MNARFSRTCRSKNAKTDRVIFQDVELTALECVEAKRGICSNLVLVGILQELVETAVERL